MTITLAEMERRTVRFNELVPCTTAFIDSRTPGSDQKENFSLIGPGVAENANQHVHVKIPHGFNIGGARQPKGCINSQHSHETSEVFLVHTGVWTFRWGHDGTDGEVTLNPGDVISIPVNVFRGFECVSDGESYLFAILGGDDPGHVTWAPYVFKEAEGHGLILTKGGRLIDRVKGEEIPADDEPYVPIGEAELKTFRTMSLDEMSDCVVREGEGSSGGQSLLTERSEDVHEAPILGRANKAEGMVASKVDFDHGFHFRKMVIGQNGRIPAHTRAEEEVLFVHQGTVTLFWSDQSMTLETGDTVTIPKGLVRSWWSKAETGATVFVVRGGDTPAAPKWVDDSAIVQKQSSLEMAS